MTCGVLLSETLFSWTWTSSFPSLSTSIHAQLHNMYNLCTGAGPLPYGIHCGQWKFIPQNLDNWRDQPRGGHSNRSCTTGIKMKSSNQGSKGTTVKWSRTDFSHNQAIKSALSTFWSDQDPCTLVYVRTCNTVFAHTRTSLVSIHFDPGRRCLYRTDWSDRPLSAQTAKFYSCEFCMVTILCCMQGNGGYCG